MKIMNFFEKWVIKRVAKKLVKSLPDLQEKGKEIIEKYSKEIEKHAQELFDKIEVAIVQFIEKYEDKSK